MSRQNLAHGDHGLLRLPGATSGMVSAVASGSQDLRQRGNTAVEVALVPGLSLLFGSDCLGADPGCVVVDTRQQDSAGRRAGGKHVKVTQPQSFRGQPVQIGCVDFAAEGTDVRVPQVIGHYQQDVGSFAPGVRIFRLSQRGNGNGACQNQPGCHADFSGCCHCAELIPAGAGRDLNFVTRSGSTGNGRMRI